MFKKIQVFLVFIFCFNIQAQPNSRFVEVTGTHQLNIEADQIILMINVKSIDDKLENSKNKNGEVIDKIVNHLNQIAKTDSDIKLTPISFGINYKREERNRVEDGYYTTQQISFTLNDLSKYYSLIDFLIKVKNVHISNSYYNNSKYEEYNKKAYENAIEAAKEKAEYLAKKANVKLGDVLEIEDNSDNKFRLRQQYPNPFNSTTALSSRSAE